MKKLLLKFVTILLCGAQLSGISTYMQPLKKNGRYYYSDSHMGSPVNLNKVLKLAPKHLKKNIKSLFKKDPANDSIKILKPTTMVPAQESIEPKIVWIGHATFLVQIDGFNILIDPIFGNVKWGPLTVTKRSMPAGISLENLPPIDAIVISHDHTDHLDSAALTALAKKHNPTVFVPEGNKKLVTSMGFANVIENSWWTDNTITKNNRSIALTCLPANHWSMYGILFGSYRKSLWSSWMISSADTNIYFAGDTANGPHFKEIAQRFPSIDMALMPIAPTEENESCHADVHIDAPEVIDAFLELNAKCFVPMHYGTFYNDKDNIEYPIKKLHTYWRKKQHLLGDKKLLFARCGEQYAVHDCYAADKKSISQYPYQDLT